MKKTSQLKRLALTALAMACLHSGASASTIFWGSEYGVDVLNDSYGNPLDTTYSFEIGTFGSFVPTYANVSEWAANWKVFDRAYDPDGNGWNAADQFFTGTVEFNTSGGSESPDANPSDVFIQGEKIYLWVYNSKTIDSNTEWALITDSVLTGNVSSQWVIPDPLAPSSDPSPDLKLVDADEAIIGGVNNVQGPGTFNATPPAFTIQTAVVPEPGSALLILAAAVAFQARRTARRLSRSTMA